MSHSPQSAPLALSTPIPPAPTHLARLYEHLVWADRRVLESLRRTPVPDPAALELFSHVLGAEHVWLARIHGRAAEVPVWPVLDLEGCAALARENADGYGALLRTLGPGDDRRPVSYRNSAGDAFTSTVEEILLHVAMHGSYHRGQIALLVRAGGAVPAASDFIAFVRGADAAVRSSGE